MSDERPCTGSDGALTGAMQAQATAAGAARDAVAREVLARDHPDYPLVTAIVCTRDRPELLRRAVSSILSQDYPGELECVVVLDQCEDDLSVPDLPSGRRLRVLPNARVQGLAGGRNTGVAAAEGELIAFCDDDDEWLPGKVRAQVELLHRRPDAAIVATGMSIVTEQETVARVPPEEVTLADLLRSRVVGLGSSSFLLRRADLIDAGGVDENVPMSYGEDYELLLRMAHRGPILSVPSLLTIIHWDRLSFFTTRWDGISDGLGYILAKYPEYGSDRVGRARVRGQIAFAHAAAGRRGRAVRWAAATLRDDPRQLRAYGAIAVASGVVRAESLLERVNARGHGL